ncbi:unnamed protein product [Gongylonema pulchrum]|uniref:Uncharacterized protein n=1 Tax=Gongylonema pulchrum TaxID=637853 RepID=A0A183E2Y7_9BILA|nr:unnamed protein product [Gongylonema pulchrum]
MIHDPDGWEVVSERHPEQSSGSGVSHESQLSQEPLKLASLVPHTRPLESPSAAAGSSISTETAHSSQSATAQNLTEFRSPDEVEAKLEELPARSPSTSGFDVVKLFVSEYEDAVEYLQKVMRHPEQSSGSGVSHESQLSQEPLKLASLVPHARPLESPSAAAGSSISTETAHSSQSTTEQNLTEFRSPDEVEAKLEELPTRSPSTSSFDVVKLFVSEYEDAVEYLQKVMKRLPGRRRQQFLNILGRLDRIAEKKPRAPRPSKRSAPEPVPRLSATPRPTVARRSALTPSSSGPPKAKLDLADNDVYNNLLRCLALYSKSIISKNELLELLDYFVGY